jgi:hypothetical protein
MPQAELGFFFFLVPAGVPGFEPSTLADEVIVLPMSFC